MSQKAAQYVHNLLVAKIQQKERELGQEFDADLHDGEAAPKPVTRDAGIQTSASICPASPIASTSTSTSSIKDKEEKEEKEVEEAEVEEEHEVKTITEEVEAQTETEIPHKKKRKAKQ